MKPSLLAAANAHPADLPARLGALWVRWRRRLAIFVAGQLSVQLLSFVTGLLVLRWLSEPEYAKAGVVLGLQTTFSAFADLGIGGSLVALIGGRGGQADVVGGYVSAARWWRRVLLAAVLPVGAVLFHLFSVRQGWSTSESLVLFVCIGVSLYFSGLSAVASAPLLIHQRLGALYAVSNAGSLARLLGCLVLHASGRLDAVTMTVLGSAISVFTGLACQQAASRHLRQPAHSDPALRREILRYVAPLVPMTAFYAVQGQLSTFLITWFGQSQGIAEVTALGRLGQLFSFLSALFVTLIVPRLASLSDARFFRRYVAAVAAVLLISGLLTVAGFAMPEALLWLLGHRYAHLVREVGWSACAGALAFASAIIWSMHAARKWVFWAGTWAYIAVIVLVQLVFVAWVDLAVPLNVVLMGVAVNAAALLHQGLVAWLGFAQHTRPRPQAAVQP